MDVSADQTTRTRTPPALARFDRTPPRRRRPSCEAPPLPHQLQTTGVGWLVASVVLVGLSIVVFAGGLRGPAVAVRVADDAVVGWLAGLDAPGLAGTWRVRAALGTTGSRRA